MIREKGKILSNIPVSFDTYKMEILSPMISRQAKCGQFVNVDVSDASMILKRPISISSIDGEIITLVYKINGAGTKKMTEMNEFIDLIGPLGKGFPLTKGKSLLVGGGIGVAPLLELAKSLEGEKVILSSFRDKESIILIDEFKKYGKVIITTDNGSEGYHGNAMDYLNNNEIEFDCLYACGPSILLRLLEEKYEGRCGYLSYESRMACGVGLCHGCVKGDKQYCVCTDGPVFPLGVIK